MSAGIDYGRFPMANGQLPNRDPVTGIRYGVIPAGRVDWWWEGAEAQYAESACPKCGGDVRTFHPRRGSKMRNNLRLHGNRYGRSRRRHVSYDLYCAYCKAVYSDDECAPDHAYGYLVNEPCVAPTLQAFSGEDEDIFVFLSPYFTRAAFCSPCAPGACYLTQPTEDGERAYCLGHEWFEGGAPYPVYRVDTGEEVPYVQG